MVCCVPFTTSHTGKRYIFSRCQICGHYTADVGLGGHMCVYDSIPPLTRLEGVLIALYQLDITLAYIAAKIAELTSH